MFKDFNPNIWNKILSYLDPQEQAYFGASSKKNHLFYKRTYIQPNPFLIPIFQQMKEMGYLLLKQDEILFGISQDKNKQEQQNLLNFLKEHKKIRDTINLVLVKNKKTLASELANDLKRYLSAFKDLFPTEFDEFGVKIDEKALLNIPSKCENKFYNPIYLRCYLEIFVWLILFDSNYSNVECYRRVILLSLLLTEMGDSSGYFCVLGILHQTMDEAEREFLCKLLGCYPELNINNVVSVDDLLKKLFGLAFHNYKNLLIDFSKEFNFYCFFYFPIISIRLLACLKNDFKENAVNLLLKTPDLIYVLLSQREFSRVYQKVFTKDANKTLETLRLKIKETGEERCLNLLSLISQHSHFHEQLPFEEFFNLFNSLLVLLMNNQDIFENAYWTHDNILKITPYLDKLKKIPEVINKWPHEELALIAQCPEDFFNWLVNCSHREYIFENIKTFSDLKKLASGKVKEVNILELLCINENVAFCQVIFERYKNVDNLFNELESNFLLQKYFSTKNIGLILEKFPQFLLQLNDIENSVYEVTILDTIITCATEKQAFLLGTEICENQLSIICENLNIFELLKNPVLRDYIERQNISFQTVTLYSQLFQLLSQELNKKHTSFIAVPFSLVSDLLKSDILFPLLWIRSETLFNWVLFNDAHPLQNNDFNSLEIRGFHDIKFLMKDSNIIKHLDNFGYYKDIEGKQRVHCDVFLTKHFDYKKICELNMIPLKNSNSLLEKICTTNPLIFRFMMRTNLNWGRQELFGFYSQNFLDVLSSSLHGWLFCLYFNSDHINFLNNTGFNDSLSCLEFFVKHENKKLFYNFIIASANQEGQLNYIPDGIPCEHTINPENFNKLLFILNPFMQKNLFYLCNMLLELFTYKDIIYLSERVHPTNNLLYFDLLTTFSSETLGDFVQKFPEFACYKNREEKIGLFLNILNNVFETVSSTVKTGNQPKRKRVESPKCEDDDSQKSKKKR